jgi:type II secretion system protein N
MKKIKEIIPYLYNFFLEFPFKKFLVIGLSIFVFLLFVLISFFSNFPAEPIMMNLNNAISPFGMEVTSEAAKISFPFKIELRSPVIYYKNKNLLAPDEMFIRIYPLKYLFGRKSLKVKVDMGDGYAELKFTLSGKNFYFKIKGKNFKYGGDVEMPLYQLSYTLSLNGYVQGRINTEDLSASDIKGDVEIKDFVLKKISFGSFEINDVKFGDLNSKLSMTNGVLSVGDVPFKSSDLEGNMNLEIVLSRRLTLSRLKGNLSVKLGFRLRQMIDEMNIPATTFLKDGNRIDLKIGGTASNPSFSPM